MRLERSTAFCLLLNTKLLNSSLENAWSLVIIKETRLFLQFLTTKGSGNREILLNVKIKSKLTSVLTLHERLTQNRVINTQGRTDPACLTSLIND